ncbi:MAG: GIY-YIG nuclease family protein [Bacteroidia bacterium]
MIAYFWIYILECADGSYYVGVTNDLQRRVREHQSGSDSKSYTAQRLPVKLVHSEHFKYINDAIKREKQLKGWTVSKKKALIENDITRLKVLSKCTNETKAKMQNTSQEISLDNPMK